MVAQCSRMLLIVIVVVFLFLCFCFNIGLNGLDGFFLLTTNDTNCTNIREICAVCCLTFPFVLVAHTASVKSVKSDVFILNNRRHKFSQSYKSVLFAFFCVFCCSRKRKSLITNCFVSLGVI